MRRAAQHTLRAGTVMLVMVALGVACSSDGPASASLTACELGATVTVATTGATPTISWSPECAVSMVAVVDSATYSAAWGIRTSTPMLRSPQRMYERPRGAYDLGPSQALVPSAPYIVILGVRYADPVTGTIGEREVATTIFRVTP